MVLLACYYSVVLSRATTIAGRDAVLKQVTNINNNNFWLLVQIDSVAVHMKLPADDLRCHWLNEQRERKRKGGKIEGGRNADKQHM